MTSAQTMLASIRHCLRAILALAGISALSAIGACQNDSLKQPSMLAGPYEQPQLWAVAPFANESGVSTVDGATIADAFVEQGQQIAQVNMAPVNRVIRAMRQLNLSSIDTIEDARAVMSLLSLDGLIVGTVTVWDPYRPPTLGIAVELYSTTSGQYMMTTDDPERFSRQSSGQIALASMGRAMPTAQAAGVFDAANHATLAQLRNYAAGRAEPDSAYGEDIYLVSMDLYTKFVGHQLLSELLVSERARLEALATAQPTR